MSADDLNKALSDYILEHCENAVVGRDAGCDQKIPRQTEIV